MRRADYLQIGIARYYKAGSEWGWYWVTDFSLNTDSTNLLDIDIDLPIVGGIGIGIPNLLNPKTPTATPTPSPTPTPAQPSAARLTSPEPGSTLSDTSATFRWTAVSGAAAYQLYVGTTPGGYDIRNVRTTATSTTVTNLPRGGMTVYVRLWTQVGGTWRYTDDTLTAAPALSPTATPTRTATATPTRTATAAPTRTPTPQSSTAQLMSPEPGSTLTGTTATFRWTAVSGASAYQLYVGTTAGGYDIRNVRTTATSTTVTNVPRGGRTVYVRLWTQIGGSWRYNDYTLTAAP
jgi:hypothetical protein